MRFSALIPFLGILVTGPADAAAQLRKCDGVLTGSTLEETSENGVILGTGANVLDGDPTSSVAIQTAGGPQADNVWIEVLLQANGDLRTPGGELRFKLRFQGDVPDFADLSLNDPGRCDCGSFWSQGLTNVHDGMEVVVPTEEIGEGFPDDWEFPALIARLSASSWDPGPMTVGFYEAEYGGPLCPGPVELGLSTDELWLNGEGWYEQNPLTVVLTTRCPSDSPTLCQGELSGRFGSELDDARFYVMDSNVPAITCHEDFERSLSEVGHVSTRYYDFSCPGYTLLPGNTATWEWKLWLQPSGETELDLTASWMGATADGAMPIPAAEIRPVVFVHGIQGSQPPQNELIVDDGGMFRRLDPFNGYYWPLLTNLQKMGYVWNETLFAVSYDWRNSNHFSAAFLAEQLRDAVIPRSSESGYASLDDGADLIVHSMGGLVTRALLQGRAQDKETLASVPYEGNVEKVVFVATPHKGFPFTYRTWESMDWAAYMDGSAMPLIYRHATNLKIWPTFVAKHFDPTQDELERDCSFTGIPPIPLGSYVQFGFKDGMPGWFVCDLNAYAGWAHHETRGVLSLREMLPTSDLPPYLYDENGNFPGPHPPEVNEFLESLNAAAQQELTEALVDPGDPFDHLGNHVFVIYGDGAPETELGYTTKPRPSDRPNVWRRGEMTGQVLLQDGQSGLLLGDNLIPFQSACLTCGPQPLLSLPPGNEAEIDASPSAEVRGRHSALMHHPETQKKLVPGWLAGYEELPFFTETMTPTLAVSGSLNVITACPVNLLITDPLGRRLGFDPASGQVLREIPGSVATGPGSEPQILWIADPLEGPYRVRVTGYASGQYTVRASFLDEGGIRPLGLFGGTTEDGKTDEHDVLYDGVPGPDPLAAVDDDYELPAGTTSRLDVLANDTFSGAPVLEVIDPPSHGTAAPQGSDILYTPDAGYAGPDSFRYRISDGVSDATAAVGVSVQAPAPFEAIDDEAFTLESTEVTIEVLANDVGARLSILSVSQPLPEGSGSAAHGPSFATFAPSPGFTGTSSFTYTVSDGTRTAAANVTVIVGPVAGPGDPTAALTIQPRLGRAPLQVALDATGSTEPDGRPLRFDWDFGDGRIATGAASMVSHQYEEPGRYIARVTVSDPDGDTSEASREILVLDEGEEILLNGSFEEGEEPWKGKGWLVPGGAPEGGARAWRVTKRSESYHGPHQDVTSRIRPDLIYSGSFWIFVEAKTSRARLRLLYADDAGSNGVDLASLENPPVRRWVQVRGHAALSWVGALKWARIRVQTEGARKNHHPGFVADRVSVRVAPLAAFEDDCEENDGELDACDLGTLEGELGRESLYIYNASRNAGGIGGDPDFYRFRLEDAARVRMRVLPVWGSGDAALELLSPDGARLARSDARRASREQIVKRLEPGEYLLKVSQAAARSELFYDLLLEAVAPGSWIPLLENGSFEEGDLDWKGKGEVVEGDAADGQHAFRSAKRREAYHGPVQEVGARIDPGLSYRASFWVKVNRRAEKAILRLAYEDARGWHKLDLAEMKNPPVGQWVRIEGQAALSWIGELKFARVRVRVTGKKAGGFYPSYLTDAIEVQVSETPPN